MNFGKESGRRLFESVRCLGCHRVGDDNRGIEGPLHASFRSHGPNLDGSGSKLDAGWLYAWIRDPKAYWHDTRMPNLRLTEREAADVTAYLMSLRQDDFMGRQRPPLDAKLRDEVLLREYLETQYTLADAKAKLDALDDHARTLLLGEKTIARYGCFGCHTISGLKKATPIGTELTEQGSKLVERLEETERYRKRSKLSRMELRSQVNDVANLTFLSKENEREDWQDSACHVFWIVYYPRNPCGPLYS